MFDLQINDEFSAFGGITGEEIVNSLREANGDDIRAFINTPGGDVFQAVPAYNAVVRYKQDNPSASVIAIVDGIAASAGTFFAQAFDEIHAYQNTSWFVHNALTFAFGHKEDLAETADMLGKLDQQIEDMLVSDRNIGRAELRSIMQGSRGDGTSFTAQEAFDVGFIDRVLPLKSRSASNSQAHDHKNSLTNRLINLDIPTHLLNADCQCERCKARKTNLAPENLDKQIRIQAQKRDRDRSRLLQNILRK